MRKTFLLCTLLLLITIGSTHTDAFGQVNLDKDAILNKLQQQKKERHTKAMIAGVWKGDQEIMTVALGESMTLIPADINMHVRIGGVSEIIYGTMFWIMVDKGIIKPDDKLSKYLLNMLSAESVTLEMLMKNTAGYKDYVPNQDFETLVTKEPFHQFSREDLLNYSIGGGQLNFPPGTQQKYSHTEFTILGEALEKASGKPMSELYAEYIIAPLDLKNTGYFYNSDMPSPVLHAFSSDRGIYEDATFWNPSWVGESGPLYSTLNDISVFARAFGKGTLLTPGSFNSLVSAPAGMEFPGPYFASGFVVGNGWYFQNPAFNGYSGAFGYFPKDELTVIIYTTESEDPKSGAQAFPSMLELIKLITPGNEIKL